MSAAVYEIQTAQSDEQILKPDLKVNGFVEHIRLFISDEDEMPSVGGLRMENFLVWERDLYVDDLITSPDARQTRLGTHLLKWLMGEAKYRSWDRIHLDAEIERGEPHRLYLNLSRLHLCRDLG